MRLLTTLALATCAVVALGRPHHEAPSRRLSGEKKHLKPNDFTTDPNYKHEGDAKKATTIYQWNNIHKPKDNFIGSSSSPSTKQGKQKQNSKKADTIYQWNNIHKPRD
ncbi:unnamed protein product [Aphanomyces euteiches]